MLHFTKSGTTHNLIKLLAIVLIGLTLSSCGKKLVQEDIILEDCVRIPKQDGEIKIRYYGKDEDSGEESYDLILDLVLECVKEVKDFELLPYIRINLLDENDVQLIYVKENIDEEFLKKKGNKSHFEFGLTLEHDSKTKKDLQKIKKNTKKITIQSDIVKSEEEKKKEEEERKRKEEENRIQQEKDLAIQFWKQILS